MTLENCRNKINEIDAQIVKLLNQRAETVTEIGRLKIKAGLPIVDLDRENQILRSVCRENYGAFEDDSIINIYRLIIQESRQLQVKTMGKMLENEATIY